MCKHELHPCLHLNHIAAAHQRQNAVVAADEAAAAAASADIRAPTGWNTAGQVAAAGESAVVDVAAVDAAVGAVGLARAPSVVWSECCNLLRAAESCSKAKRLLK